MKHILPKISIITPSFNQGVFIEDAIRSVLEQAYPNFEHIIIDNCSADGTLEILKKYDHLIWTSEPDEGQSDALNKGFDLASGDIIGWLNTDEFYMPGTFVHLSSHVIVNKKNDIFYGDVVFTGQDGDFWRLKAGHSFHLKTLLYNDYGCYIPTVSTFFRKQLISDGFFINRGYNICMDLEYFLRLAMAKKKFIYIPRPLGVFRWHQMNKSLDDAQSVLEGMNIRKYYSKIKNSWVIWFLTKVYRILHSWKKIHELRYYFELKCRRFIGWDFRWFQNERLKRHCLELEKIYDTPSKLIKKIGRNNLCIK